MLEMTTGESDTVASGAVTVANSSTFVEDYGGLYAATGVQLTPVASSPAQGQYSVSAGLYLQFRRQRRRRADLLQLHRRLGNKISLANQLTGPLPTFEISLKETFNYFGTSKDLPGKLNACVSSKLSLPFSNQKFTVAEFDFQVDRGFLNNIGTIKLSE